MTDHSVNIRTIQHFMYCKRRWGLLEINNDWAENAFVVKANLMHENVHDGKHRFSDRNMVVRSSVAIYNDEPIYDLYGIADCIEFVRNENGVKIDGLEGLYSVNIIEYKPKAPSKNEYSQIDAMQVFAQKLCADYVWKCNSVCYLYYSDIRKRVKLPFDSEFTIYDDKIKRILNEMRVYFAQNKIPDKEKGQKCLGCSMVDICYPDNRKYSVRNEINKIKKEG